MSAPPADDGVLALGTRLATDANRLVRAEIALAKARLAMRVQAAKSGAILLVAALVLALAAIGALLVGLILTLAPRLGPGLATLTVVAGALLLAGLFGWIGARRIGRVTASAEALS